jgi:hypothetical protein
MRTLAKKAEEHTPPNPPQPSLEGSKDSGGDAHLGKEGRRAYPPTPPKPSLEGSEDKRFDEPIKAMILYFEIGS